MLPGREGELHELSERFRAGPFAAVISGPPGVGKSRLVAELARRLQVRVLRCEADPSASLSPLAPLASLVQPEPPHARLLPLLRPPVQFTTRQRSRLARAGFVVLRRLARRTPLVVVIEDIEHADPSTQEFVKTLSTLRVVTVLATSQHRFAGWPELRLGPLGGADLALMVAEAGLPEEASQWLAQASPGWPLEVEEALVNAREILRAHPGLPVSRLHTRLRDCVAARLLRLGPLGAQLARVTSCLEPGFTWAQVLAVAPLWMDPALVEPLWQRLIEQGLLVPRGPGYALMHTQVRDEIYQSIDGATRVRLHQRIAERNRRSWEEDRPELLAYHYTRAGLVTQAGEFWQRAAARAAGRGALHEAIGQLREALALGGDPAAELDLRISLGRLLVATRGYGDAEVQCTYRQALELSESQPAGFRAVHGLFLYHLLRGHVHIAERLAQRCLDLSRDDPDQRMEAELATAVSDFYFGRMRPSLERLQVVLALYREDRHAGHCLVYGQDPRVAALSYSAWALAVEGRLTSGRTLACEAVEMAERLGHPFSLAIALHFQAIVAMISGDVEGTLASAARGVAHSRSEGVRFFEADTAIVEGWALAHSGQPEAGKTRMRAGLTGVRALGAELGWPFVLSMFIDCSEDADALDLLAEAVAHADAMHYFNRPVLLCMRGEKSGSVAELEEARAQARAWGSPWVELRALVAWSRLTGRPHADLPALLEQLPEAVGSPRVRAAQQLLEGVSVSCGPL